MTWVTWVNFCNKNLGIFMNKSCILKYDLISYVNNIYSQWCETLNVIDRYFSVAESSLFTAECPFRGCRWGGPHVGPCARARRGSARPRAESRVAIARTPRAVVSFARLCWVARAPRSSHRTRMILVILQWFHNYEIELQTITSYTRLFMLVLNTSHISLSNSINSG